MKVKVKKVGKQFDAKVRKAGTLNNQNVQMGWFKEQGIHSGTKDNKEPLTYARLVAIHHFGLGGQIRRPVLTVVADMLYPVKKDKRVNQLIKRWFRTLDSSSPETLLDDIGTYYVRRIYNTFGGDELTPTENNDSPLIDTEELRDNTAHKNTISNKVKTK